MTIASVAKLSQLIGTAVASYSTRLGNLTLLDRLVSGEANFATLQVSKFVQEYTLVD